MTFADYLLWGSIVIAPIWALFLYFVIRGGAEHEFRQAGYKPFDYEALQAELDEEFGPASKTR
jgi:hypothetical protein